MEIQWSYLDLTNLPVGRPISELYTGNAMRNQQELYGVYIHIYGLLYLKYNRMISKKKKMQYSPHCLLDTFRQASQTALFGEKFPVKSYRKVLWRIQNLQGDSCI